MTADQARTLIANRFNGAQVDGTAPIVISVPVDAWVPFAHFGTNRARLPVFLVSHGC